ncbi:MAG: hypothetical protein WCC27_04780 [Acidobacteriaceae bacterium]
MTIQNRPVKSQKLAGIVMAGGQPFPEAHVEECDANWQHVLSSTRTDANGHFRLAPVGKGSVHYLRVYAPNFNLSEYPVILSRFAHAELQFQLYPGT